MTKLPGIISIDIIGTRTNKLRARVRNECNGCFEVTIGGEKWKTLPRKLQSAILSNAEQYVGILNKHLLDACKEKLSYGLPVKRIPDSSTNQQSTG